MFTAELECFCVEFEMGWELGRVSNVYKNCISTNVCINFGDRTGIHSCISKYITMVCICVSNGTKSIQTEIGICEQLKCVRAMECSGVFMKYKDCFVFQRYMNCYSLSLFLCFRAFKYTIYIQYSFIKLTFMAAIVLYGDKKC